MKSGIGFRQQTRTSTTLRVDPRLVLNSHLLELSSHELEAAIENELSENPALSRLEEDHDPITQETILKSIAPTELAPSSEDFEFTRSLPQGSSDDVDWLDMASSDTSLADHLRGQLIPILPNSLRHLAEYLIGSVNERGYLTVTVEEAANDTGTSIENAQAAINALQSCDPAGVGATTLQECLLLQLRNVSIYEERLARTILRKNFDDFLNRRTKTLMRKYGVHPDVIDRAFDIIVSLNPFPGEAYRPHSGHSRNDRSAAVSHDIELAYSESGWTVIVRGPEDTSLGINRFYRERQTQLENAARSAKEEKAHVTEHVDRANRFIGAVRQRRETLRKIGQFLIDHQSGFVSTGQYQFLRSLTRAEMAQQLGIHESTVSRATMDKFVKIATGEVVSFDVFFKPALRIQKMIEDILSTENPNNPLSDERIAQILAERGIEVARRTVNKYRDRTKLLSSRRRRSA